LHSPQRRKLSGAFLGTVKGVAEAGFESKRRNTSGLSRKCRSRAAIRFWSLGGSDSSWGISFVLASLHSWNNHTRPHGLDPAAAQMSEPVRSARDSSSRE